MTVWLRCSFDPVTPYKEDRAFQAFVCAHVTCDRTLLAPGLHSEQRGYERVAHRRARVEVQASSRSSPIYLPAHLGSRPEVPAEAAGQPPQSHAQEELLLCLHSPEVEQPFGKFRKNVSISNVITATFNIRFTCAQSKRRCLFFF